MDVSAPPLPDFPNPGTGRDALVGQLGAYLSGWNDYETSIKELIDRGDDLIAIVHERARIRGSDRARLSQAPSAVAFEACAIKRTLCSEDRSPIGERRCRCRTR